VIFAFFVVRKKRGFTAKSTKNTKIGSPAGALCLVGDSA
jgi:hypothetical protein